MKNLYILMACLLFPFYASGSGLSQAHTVVKQEKRADPVDTLRMLLHPLAEAFASAGNKKEKNAALSEMYDIDKDAKRGKIIREAARIDTASSAAECRRVGVLCLTGGFQDAANACFRLGARRGDMYCVNRCILDALLKRQDMSEALGYLKFLEFDRFSYIPLIHNLVLLFYYSGIPELKVAAYDMANAYVELKDYAEIEMRSFSRGEYLHYIDTPDMHIFDKCWQAADSWDTVGREVRRISAESKQGDVGAKKPSEGKKKH